MKKLILFFFSSSLFLSCSMTAIKEMDRSKLNSNALRPQNFSQNSTLSPHTNLRNSSNSTAGCSVCAH